MGFPVSEAYSLPMNAKSLVRSVMANLCGSHYPIHIRAQVRALGVDVASLTSVVAEDARSVAWRSKGGLH